MKFPHLLPILLTALSLTAPLSAREKDAPARPQQPTEAETAMLYEKAAAFLRTAIQVDENDQASSHCLRRGKYTRIEWRNLVFRQLILGSISSKDKKNGINRRIYAQLGSDAHRLTDDKGTTAWRSGRFQEFPNFVMIEQVGDEYRLSAPGIDLFSPNPGRTPVQPAVPTNGDETLVAKRF